MIRRAVLALTRYIADRAIRRNPHSRRTRAIVLAWHRIAATTPRSAP
ncbi:MAG TPA: hypothetical protein VHA75_01745 [Rugosimonospora sp.]|nr:hypothetical protein [Rugosimonospora sp.]